MIGNIVCSGGKRKYPVSFLYPSSDNSASPDILSETRIIYTQCSSLYESNSIQKFEPFSIKMQLGESRPSPINFKNPFDADRMFILSYDVFRFCNFHYIILLISLEQVKIIFYLCHSVVLLLNHKNK
jgi:hypothetical protein